MWVYFVLPSAVALVLAAVIMGICCKNRSHKRPPSVCAASPRSFINPNVSVNTKSDMEMNSLLPSSGSTSGSVSIRTISVKPLEYSISAVRFIQELGDGVFGKVYRGDLGGIIGGVTASVVIKTLKPGANEETRQEFQRESNLMCSLRHTNIVCLLGVVVKDEPKCLIFEYMVHGDLHEYLTKHSPKSKENVPIGNMSLVSGSDGESNKLLDHGDMSYIAIQIASGMEYLSQHCYVHR